MYINHLEKKKSDQMETWLSKAKLYKSYFKLTPLFVVSVAAYARALIEGINIAIFLLLGLESFSMISLICSL